MALNIPEFLKQIGDYNYQYDPKDFINLPVTNLILIANIAAMRTVMIQCLAIISEKTATEIDDAIEREFAVIFQKEFDKFVIKHGKPVNEKSKNPVGN
jgi:hypothetical protein